MQSGPKYNHDVKEMRLSIIHAISWVTLTFLSAGVFYFYDFAATEKL